MTIEQMPGTVIRELLTRELYCLMGKYMFYIARANESGQIADLHLAEGIMIASKQMERAVTSSVSACTFIESRTNNMMLRDDKQNAIRELYVLANQAIKG